MTISDRSYHDTVKEVYREAANAPATNLCCVPQSPRFLPGLHVPDIMHEMNYGCGSTVHLQDMRPNQTMLYVGVGGGLELLQLAYFARRPGAVIGVDPVPEMRMKAKENLELAAESNEWFDPSFVDIREGDALRLPIDDEAVDFAAQNCLFNIFQNDDLSLALREMQRVLSRGGRLVMSDPITPRSIPEHLVEDARLRALCLSGCQLIDDYLEAITDAGFGAIEVRSRKPYRMLDAEGFNLDEDLMLETIEVAAYNVKIPNDGACIFTGKTAVYRGIEEQFDDGNGHVLQKNIPLGVCDKTAAALSNHIDIFLTPSNWHYGGDGCC